MCEAVTNNNNDPFQFWSSSRAHVCERVMAASVLLRAARVRVGRSATVLLTRGESRGAYQMQGGQISWLLAAAVGVAGGTSIMVSLSPREAASLSLYPLAHVFLPSLPPSLLLRCIVRPASILAM